MKELTDKEVCDDQGRWYRLTNIVGKGSQGVVYKEDSGKYVVKITRAKNRIHAHELERRYRWLLNREVHPRVIVPLAILAGSQPGYIMTRVKGHQPLARLFYPIQHMSLGQWYNQETGGLRRRLKIAGWIARIFRNLHLNGLVYCDISANNLLVDKNPASASVYVIDPDNLSISGKAQSLVMGTPKFMAPEILKGTHQPDSLTDSYSLAVLIFWLLRLGHPLLGDQVLQASPDEEEKALQGDYPYIDHPTDNSNRCSLILPAEAVCTNQLIQFFQKVFVEGIAARTQRSTAGEWEEECFFAADSTIDCSNCTASFFPRPESTQKQFSRCPWCGSLNSIPPMLRFVEFVQIGNKLEKTKYSRIFFLRSTQATLTARYIAREFNGEEGDREVGILTWEPVSGKVSLLNSGNFPIYYIRPGDRRRAQLAPRQELDLLIGSRISFKDHQENTLVREALLDQIGRIKNEAK